MHLIGFIIRMCHDARSSECPIINTVCVHTWWYEQPQETQGPVHENEDEFLMYVFVCRQIVIDIHIVLCLVIFVTIVIFVL